VSTPVTTPAPAAEPKFDVKAFIAGRNSGAPAKIEEPQPAPAAESVKPGAAAGPDDLEQIIDQVPDHRLSRSVRRELNRLREELGAARGQLDLARQLGLLKSPAEEPVKAAAEDIRPARKDFATDPEFERAMGRWEARQEAKKVVDTARAEQDQVATMEALRAQAREALAKAEKDRAELQDWDQVQEKAEGMTIGPNLQAMIMLSDQQAFVLHYLATHEVDYQHLIEKEGDFDALKGAFGRLEGKVEVIYSSETSKPAAQAASESPKDRSHPEKAAQARATAQATEQATKPKPSAEVAARGGIPAPEEPKPGTAAWAARRNQAQFAR